MSEPMTIFFVGLLWGVIQLLMSAILGWLAYEIRCLRHDVGHRVHVAECERRMIEQSRRLKNLERIKKEKKVAA
ncbi:MAG: hypothetical protein PHS41_10765 [Victivallaceae bacterium]|nr:hypothetical protein [Victivallaceae bacterium]